MYPYYQNIGIEILSENPSEFTPAITLFTNNTNNNIEKSDNKLSKGIDFIIAGIPDAPRRLHFGLQSLSDVCFSADYNILITIGNIVILNIMTSFFKSIMIILLIKRGTIPKTLFMSHHAQPL